MNIIIKKHRLLLLLCTTICVMLFLTGCDSMEDKLNCRKWQAQASQNALSYIKEKYGFQAKVKKCRCARTAGLFGSSPYSYCLVTMKYDDREFYVWIDGDFENTDGIDNYQAQEISEALEEEITNCIGEKPAYFQLMQLQCPLYGSLNDACDNMFHAYYDGTNLYEVLSEDDIECAIFFDNGRDVSQDSLDQITEHMDFSGSMGYALFEEISFVSNKGMQTAKENVISDLRCYSGSLGIDDERIFIDNTLSITYLEDETLRETSRIITKQVDDIIYSYEEAEHTDWEIQKSEQELDITTFHGHGFLEPRAISDSYKITSQTKESDINVQISIYFPKEIIPEKELEKVQIGYMFTDEEGEVYRKVNFIRELGDYYVTTISCTPDENNIQFVLAINED